MVRLSPQIFFQYLTCPHWVWFDRFGDKHKKGEMNELQQKLLEQGVAHEEKFMMAYARTREVKRISVNGMTESAWQKACAETRAYMIDGAAVIYQGRLRSEKFEGIPDLLVRREIKSGEKKSKFGAWFYEPIDIKSAHELKEEYKFQLTTYALLLEDAQGVRPSQAGIITIDGERRDFVVADFQEKFFSVLGEIEKIVGGEKPPLSLTKSCTNSPWFTECIAQAETADDIALLYKVDRRALVALRDRGVCTIEDARHIDPSALDGEIPYLKKNGLARMKLQAESLHRKNGGAPNAETIFMRTVPHLPDAPCVIYFDIEGDPLYGLEYLFGFLIDQDGQSVYKPFVAERPEDEGSMWLAFLAWADTLPTKKNGDGDFVVYHYATYEKSRLTMLAQKYAARMRAADHAALARFAACLFDLNDVVKENFVFPLYFYGLKDVAKFLGFRWRDKKAGGAQSIFWYENWLESSDRSILQTIVDYNEDDVRATKFLQEWISRACAGELMSSV